MNAWSHAVAINSPTSMKQKGKIWLIGGTSDAVAISQRLSLHGLAHIISTTTALGSQLAGSSHGVVLQQALSPDAMQQLISTEGVCCVIDASHPFAAEVSTNAINVCETNSVPYLRFERRALTIEGASYYTSYTNMVTALQKTDGNILLTIGSKHVGAFAGLAPGRVIARVLPVADSIALCEAAGLSPLQIIACMGLLSKQLNKAMMIDYNIRHLVTKESGAEGGLIEKTEAARELGVHIHVLQRPTVHYPQQYDHVDALMNRIIEV